MTRIRLEVQIEYLRGQIAMLQAILAALEKTLASEQMQAQEENDRQKEAKHQELLTEQQAIIDVHAATKLDELPLSVRVSHCLRYEGITTIGELMQKTESDLLRMPNFGRRSLNELRQVLAEMGLFMRGMHHFSPPIPPQPPVPDLHTLSREQREQRIWEEWQAGGRVQREIVERYGLSTTTVNQIIGRFWRREIMPTLKNYRESSGSNYALGMKWYNSSSF